MSNFKEIKAEEEKRTSELFKSCGVFWAFSKKQFDENKTPLQEGEKYITIGGGGYMPKGKYQTLIDGNKAIDVWKKSELKKSKEVAVAEIEYELSNHECYYTGDISGAWEVLKDNHKKELVLKVYYATKAKHQECF